MDELKDKETIPSNSAAYHKAGDAAMVMTLTSIVNVCLSVLPFILIAYFFGLGRISDSYFLATSILVMISAFCHFGTLQPIYISVLSNFVTSGKIRIQEVFSNLLNTSLLAAILSATVCVFLAPYLVSLIAPGFDPATKLLAVGILRYLLISLVFITMTSLFNAVLHFYNKFILQSVLQIIPISVMILVVILTYRIFGIFSFVWGTIIGNIVHLTTGFLCIRSMGINYKFILKPMQSEVRETLKLVSPFYIASVVTQAKGAIQNILASFLPMGSLSMLTYAKRFRLYMRTHLIRVIPTIIYPTLTKTIALNDQAKVKEILLKSIRMSNFILLPIIIWVIVLSTPIVKLLLERGAFNPQDTKSLALALMVISIGLLPAPTHMIVNHTLYALKSTKWMNLVDIITQFYLIGVSFLFYYLMGFLGLVIAIASKIFVEFSLNSYHVNKKIGLTFILRDNTFAKILALALLMALGCSAVFILLDSSLASGGFWIQVAKILIVVSTGLIVYIGGAYFTKLQE